MEDLHRLLRQQGPTPGASLTRQLGISPATLSRRVRAAQGQIVRIGKTRGARYGLLDDLPGIGAHWPVWEIDPDGRPVPRGELHWLHGPATYWEMKPGQGQLFEGMPPFIADMAPQGFLGQLFSRRFPELEFPPRLSDWQESHILRALVLRGEDLPGHLIIGSVSMDRFLQTSPRISRPEDYPAISRALVERGNGSSAAGEFPKFTAFDGEHHLLVKFTAGDQSPADRRWRDLLLCEHHAAATLADAEIPSAITRPVEQGEQLFLEIQRFDRQGARGRHPVLTLGAIDDAWFGHRDNWPQAARRLAERGWISAEDHHRILLLEAFGRLIHNNDRHFGNLAFFWQPGTENPQLKLAPSYDQLPMALAPAANGMLPQSAPQPPSPTAALLPVWDQANELAEQFRARLAKDERISGEFKVLISPG
jgi:hypothetical protein